VFETTVEQVVLIVEAHHRYCSVDQLKSTNLNVQSSHSQSHSLSFQVPPGDLKKRILKNYFKRTLIDMS